MKKTVVAVTIVVLFLALGGTAYAAQDTLPGDALYPVKMAIERTMVMFRGGDDLARAERALNFGDKRLREMIVLNETGRTDDIDASVEKYCDALNVSVTRMEEALGKGKAQAGDIAARVAATTSAHLPVLDELYATVPEQAKPAIQRAMEEAWRCYQRAIQAQQQLGLEVTGLGTVPGPIEERI